MKSKIEKAKTIILPIKGGIGRNIFATAVVRNFRKAYPDKKIFVVAGTQDIFFHNPHVNRIYGFNTVQHLYEDYIEKNPDTLLLEVEPYTHPDYLSGNRHVVECWCDMLEIPCEDTSPEIHFSRNEIDMAKAFKAKFDKPMILFQHIGGKIPQTDEKQEAIIHRNEMYRRSLREDTVQDVADQLKKDGYVVGAVQAPKQFAPVGAERICFPVRAIIALLTQVEGVIAIDSFLQHAAAAFNKKALVLWCGTSPDRLGYKLHDNVRRNVCPTPECHRPNSYAFDVQPNGVFIWDCPYGDACTDYKGCDIIDAYKKMVGNEYTSTVKNFKKNEPRIIVDNPNVKHVKCEHQ